MTEAEKYLDKVKIDDIPIGLNYGIGSIQLKDLLQSYADEQVKKALEGSHLEAYNLGKRKALEEIEKSLMSDKEIMNRCQYLDIDNQPSLNGLALSVTKNQRNKTQEVINELKTK